MTTMEANLCETKNFSLSGSSMDIAERREDKYAIVIVGEDNYDFEDFEKFCDIYWYADYDQLEINDLKEFYEIVMVVA